MTSRPAALAGLTVLDLTRMLPGAFASQMLADLGEEVIKVEDPRGGDYNSTRAPLVKTESGSFLLLNRNKKSLTLNLKSPAVKEAFLSLADKADVVLEGFQPGVMDRLGLAYEVLRARNTRLVYCAISGFGQDGPHRLTPGHDINYLAIAGALQLFGKAGEPPIVPDLSIADVGGGSLIATTGILAALLSRVSTGEGQYVSVSMTDGTVAWFALHGADYLVGGIEPRGGERLLIGQGALLRRIHLPRRATRGCGRHRVAVLNALLRSHRAARGRAHTLSGGGSGVAAARSHCPADVAASSRRMGRLGRSRRRSALACQFHGRGVPRSADHAPTHAAIRGSSRGGPRSPARFPGETFGDPMPNPPAASAAGGT